MTDRFCKDCKHSRGEEDLVCDHPNNRVEFVNRASYLVTGIEQPIRKAMRGGNCEALRMARDPVTEATTCGPEGKWWEAK